ncbi:hypothetical protein PMAYCL1PPCAC_26749, partial [Pristionchus mayeri]
MAKRLDNRQRQSIYNRWRHRGMPFRRSLICLIFAVEILHSELGDSLLEGDVHDLKEVAHLVLGEPLLRLGVLSGLNNSLLVLPLSDVSVILSDDSQTVGSCKDTETKGGPATESDQGRDGDGLRKNDRVRVSGVRHPE